MSSATVIGKATYDAIKTSINKLNLFDQMAFSGYLKKDTPYNDISDRHKRIFSEAGAQIVNTIAASSNEK
jgi:hypothetical protein